MRTFSKLGMLVGLLAAVGCSGQAPSDPGSSQSTLSTAPAVAQKPDAKHLDAWRHHERPELMSAALKLGSLSADQRTRVQAEVDKVRAAHQAIRTAGEQLHAAVLAATRAGTVEPSALQPQLDALDKAASAAAAARTGALVQLHGILSATQRAELVSTIQAQMPRPGERPAFMGKHQRMGMGMGMGQRVAAGQQMAAGPHMAAGHACAGHERGGEHGLLMGLDLTEAQRQQIADERFLDGAEKAPKPDFQARFAEHRAALDKMLTAFKSDSFDASSVPDNSKMATFMKEGAERRISMLAKILPILDAGQRTKLVERLSNPEWSQPMMQRHEHGQIQRPAMQQPRCSPRRRPRRHKQTPSTESASKYRSRAKRAERARRGRRGEQLRSKLRGVKRVWFHS